MLLELEIDECDIPKRKNYLKKFYQKLLTQNSKSKTVLKVKTNKKSKTNGLNVGDVFEFELKKRCRQYETFASLEGDKLESTYKYCAILLDKFNFSENNNDDAFYLLGFITEPSSITGETKLGSVILAKETDFSL